MKKLYLIRHGSPLNPERRCLGRRDIPLAPEANFQAALLNLWLPKPDIVISSPLRRCTDFAELVFETTPIIEKNLTELDMGKWDNLTFAEIKEKFPETYNRRGTDLIHAVPEGGEAPADALQRVYICLQEICRNYNGNIVVFCHHGVMRLLLAYLQNVDLNVSFSLSQAYGCVNILTSDITGLRLEEQGIQPKPMLNEENCRYLLTRTGCTDNIIRHCFKVAEVSAELVDKAGKKGYLLDKDLIYSAALVHDIARAYPNHAQEGARWLEHAGYLEESNLVRQHHDLDSADVTNEAILYLADKLVKEDRRVSLEERFLGSESKCKTAEAMQAHEKRKKTAYALYNMIEEKS